MKATGIVRRIDDLGRVVVPKEIRRTLHIREGDPLEIFTDTTGGIILKKFSPIGELKVFAKEYCECIAKTLGHIVCVIDKEIFIAASGINKKEFLDKNVSKKLGEFLNNREILNSSRGSESFIQVLDEEFDKNIAHQLITPIIANGDLIGAILILSLKENFTDIENKVSEIAANFLSKQIES